MLTFDLAILSRKKIDPMCRFGQTESAMKACERRSDPRVIPLGRLGTRKLLQNGSNIFVNS